ncbi:MAG: YafY family protein [Pseudomonadota bacterium]
MRRADRLFDIIQLLRRNRLVRAQDLAAALEVSERTIYRDIAALIASGVPIEGEAGVGYILRGGFDLPPLMFTEDEIEALVLGARIVRSWADQGLAAAAESGLAKIQAVLPDRLQAHMDAVPIDAPANHYAAPIDYCRGTLRRAIGERRKIRFRYTNGAGEVSDRTVCPLLLSFFGPVWTLTAWCEMRQDFRVFRLDRIVAPETLETGFGPEYRARLDATGSA